MRNFKDRTLGDAREYEDIVESGTHLPRSEAVLGQSGVPTPSQQLAQDIADELQNACITTLQAPYVLPPMGHRPRQMIHAETVPFGTIVTLGNRLVIPQDCQGALYGFGQGLAPTAGGVPLATMWAVVSWTLCINNTPISPDFAMFPGQIGTFVSPCPLNIMLRPGDVITVIVANGAAATNYDASVRIVGADWPTVNKFDREKCFTKKPRD